MAFDWRRAQRLIHTVHFYPAVTSCEVVTSKVIVIVKVKKGIAVCRQACHHRYGNSHAIWDHTVLPATRQR